MLNLIIFLGHITCTNMLMCPEEKRLNQCLASSENQGSVWAILLLSPLRKMSLFAYNDPWQALSSLFESSWMEGRRPAEGIRWSIRKTMSGNRSSAKGICTYRSCTKRGHCVLEEGSNLLPNSHTASDLLLMLTASTPWFRRDENVSKRSQRVEELSLEEMRHPFFHTNMFQKYIFKQKNRFLHLYSMSKTKDQNKIL